MQFTKDRVRWRHINIWCWTHNKQTLDLFFLQPGEQGVCMISGEFVKLQMFTVKSTIVDYMFSIVEWQWSS